MLTQLQGIITMKVNINTEDRGRIIPYSILSFSRMETNTEVIG